MDMKKELNIRCRDLGVDHDGFVSGDSLESLVSCVEQQLSEQGVRTEYKRVGTTNERRCQERTAPGKQASPVQKRKPFTFG